MLLRQRVKTALSNIQGGCQIEETKKYGLSERPEQNSRKRIKQNRDTNLSDAEFKTLVISTKMTEYGCKIGEEVKAMQSEIKIYREPTVTGKQPGLKSTVWSRRKK